VTKLPATWPKQVPELTPDQKRIQDDWMHYFHEVLPQRHGGLERFSHEYPVRRAATGVTLEIGAGLGEHIRYEDLSNQRYYALELREDMADDIRERFPEVETVVADCQRRLPWDDDFFDRAVAIHVLEHLPNLPAALDELVRVLKPGGRLDVVIPCEGGLGYTLGRKLTVQRTFERRYNTSYDWHIKSDHVNTPAEILQEVGARFVISDRRYWPLRIPSVNLNLALGFMAGRM
jgi:SAM-dependent methyltransferase